MREEMQRELSESKAPTTSDDADDFLVVHDTKPVISKKKGTYNIDIYIDSCAQTTIKLMIRERLYDLMHAIILPLK